MHIITQPVHFQKSERTEKKRLFKLYSTHTNGKDHGHYMHVLKYMAKSLFVFKTSAEWLNINYEWGKVRLRESFCGVSYIQTFITIVWEWLLQYLIALVFFFSPHQTSLSEWNIIGVENQRNGGRLNKFIEFNALLSDCGPINIAMFKPLRFFAHRLCFHWSIKTNWFDCVFTLFSINKWIFVYLPHGIYWQSRFFVDLTWEASRCCVQRLNTNSVRQSKLSKLNKKLRYLHIQITQTVWVHLIKILVNCCNDTSVMNSNIFISLNGAFWVKVLI